MANVTFSFLCHAKGLDRSLLLLTNGNGVARKDTGAGIKTGIGPNVKQKKT